MAYFKRRFDFQLLSGSQKDPEQAFSATINEKNDTVPRFLLPGFTGFCAKTKSQTLV
jgi:hypothetical protein